LCASYTIVVYNSLTATQIDGTARFSILSDLIERNTDKDGHIDSEDDIAACAAVTYAGESSHAIFLAATQVWLCSS
jgi:hypothetical protein